MKRMFFTSFCFLGILFMAACISSVSAHQTLLDLRFDEGTGKIAKDASKYGNNGALEGAEWSDGQRGKGIQVDGSTCVRVKNDPTLDIVGVFTLEFWMAATGADANIMAKVEEGKLGTGEWYASNYAYAFGGEGQLRFVIGGGDDETGTNILGTETPFNDNKWHHVAGTFDGKVQTLYVDGEQVVSADKPRQGNVIEPKSNNGDFFIGKGTGWGNRFVVGVLDEVKLWDGALSAAEVKQAMDGELPSTAVASSYKLSTTWGRIKTSY